ncbi:Polyadenylate-binding protein-interacting protein 10 [Zea mays]|uniref:Polyadenylate-binding protein-interacting protein 10 n=1 Tax=Zea mays TaxID=4577 RepID=A0A1D6LXI9_MAIZE|nr:Polyadenylate-binding protein-interacting protein 10 [Zea mays]
MAMASQCAPSVPPNRSANNGVQRQRRGDDVRDTALLEPSKQPSVTFSVKVLEFLDSKSETDVDVDYNSLYSKQDFLQGEIHAIRDSYLRFARSHMVKYGVEITLQRLGVSGRALSVAAFGSTKSRINGGALIMLPFCQSELKTLGSGANFSSIVQVTEENLAALFINCGQVVDCRMCGDPNSVLRFAFIEFTDEEGARAALNLSGTVLGYYLVNSDDECEMCARTIYCTNIDKKVTQADLKLFFESICGEVGRSLLQTQSPFCTTKSLQKWHHQDRSGDQQDHGLHQV